MLFLAKKIMKGIALFDQKHGLTPLEKCDFNDFETGEGKGRNEFAEWHVAWLAE